MADEPFESTQVIGTEAEAEIPLARSRPRPTTGRRTRCADSRCSSSGVAVRESAIDGSPVLVDVGLSIGGSP